VFEGHAFVVEAAVSVGGRDMKAGINVYRFANRIPLLFEGGNDVITKTALKRINWGSYKINQSSDKVGGRTTNQVAACLHTCAQRHGIQYITLTAAAIPCCC
jgi:DNA topoisomerase VI subunit B